MRVRIRFGRRSDLLARLQGELAIERGLAAGGKEFVRLVELYPWLLYDPEENTFSARVEIDIEALFDLAETRESAREVLEFLEEHKEEVAKKIVEAECRDMGKEDWFRERGVYIVEVHDVKVEEPHLKFVAVLREENIQYYREIEDDLWIFSRLVQNLNEGWGNEDVAGIVDEMMEEG